MRAIDADAFKEYIRGACEDMKHLFKDNADFAKLITESFCKDIDEQPTIQPEPHWIPVEQELPEEETDVLVTVHFLGLKRTHRNGWNEHIKETFYVEVASHINGEWGSASDEYKIAKDRHKVVAWMPLLEPYKGVTE